MATIKHFKTVAALPGSLEANAIYYVRKGGGVDIYVTNSSGTVVASPHNQPPFPNLRDYGGVGNGTTNADAALVDAIAALKEFNIPAGDYLVTGNSNPLGVEMTGDGRLLKAITGGFQQLNSAADVGQHVFGQEYLYAFHERLRNKLASTILCSGDSTTSGGYAGLDAGFYIHELLMNLGFDAGHSISAVNGGHAAKHTGEWVSDYLAADLATNPHCYVVRWGINDPWAGRTITQFATSLRQGLAQIRASKDVSQLSILLMAPNSTADTANGRDERWYEQARKVCRRAARDYQCAFIDTYSLWQDARNGADRWMDNPSSLGALHPKSVMNTWIAWAMGSLLFPPALVSRMPSGNTTLAALPSTYPFGWSSTGATDFPVANCTVFTLKNRGGGLIQIATSNFESGGFNGNYPRAQIAIRTGLYVPASSIDIWHGWITRPSVILTGQNSWAQLTPGTLVSRASLSGQVVTLSGGFKNGTVTNGTVICTLPEGFRPRNDIEHFLVAANTSGTTVCRLSISSNGNITIVGGGNAAGIYLSGISFEAGA